MRQTMTLVTFALVCVTWVIFRAESFESMTIYVSRMFTAWTWSGRGEWIGLGWAGALLVLVILQQLVIRYRASETVWARMHPALQGAVLAAAILLVAAFRVDEIAFLYFQF